jgi:peptidoglycan/xylan/chitin deacetylase (PgdA/CDA1 family)
MAARLGGFGGIPLVAGARWAARGKDAGSVRISNTDATEDKASRRSSAFRRLSVVFRRALLTVAVVALVLASSAGATRRGIEVERLPTGAKVVALTFDAGWDGSGADRILAALARHRATATFFMTGKWVKHYPRLARRIGRLYPVGNHSWSHPRMTGMSSAAIRYEIRRADFWIRAGTGRSPRPFFRFPYGDRNARTIAVANALGYTSVRWSLDTWGWMGPSGGMSKAAVIRRVATKLAPGDIVLLHVGANRDRSTLDTDALPELLNLIERRGYRFVTLERFVTAPR